MSAALSASAADIDFSYNLEGGATFGYGFDKAETYDVAIRIDQPSLVGNKIVGLRVPLASDGIGSASIWLSTELSLKRSNGKNINNPDICVKEGTADDGWLDLTFDTPYTIEGPLFAGYSFTVGTVGDSNGKPVTLVAGNDADGFYLHTSKSRLKWNSAAEAAGGVSAMTVLIEGDIQPNAAVFMPAYGLRASAEEESNHIMLRVANHGENEILSLDYTYEIDGHMEGGTVEFDEPLPAVWGAFRNADIELKNLDETGEKELKITVTKVNGADNTDNSPTTTIPITVYPFIPVNRPLVEEYTGLWCGYCTRGYAALENMKGWYADFVAIAYHQGDAMSVNNLVTPNSPSGLPAGYINRSSINIGNVYTVWPQFAATLAPASIDVSAEWADEEHTKIKARSAIRFIKDIAFANYGVEYTLVADGLSNPDWVQTNYYAPEEGEEPKDVDEMPGYWGHFFTHGKKAVRGLVFNDVAIASKFPKGAEGSIPTTVAAGQVYEHSCLFDISEIHPSESGSNILEAPDHFRVIAALIDRSSGNPVNCNTSLYMNGESGIENVYCTDGEASDVVATEWYDLFGRKVDAPLENRRVLIRIDKFSDGSTRAAKILR